MLLDRGQPADGGDDRHAVRAGRARARARAARRVVDGRKRRQVEAERHHAVLLGAADAIAVEQLVPNRRRDRDDGDR